MIDWEDEIFDNTPDNMIEAAKDMIVNTLKDCCVDFCGSDLAYYSYKEINANGCYNMYTVDAEENMKGWSYYFISEVIPYMIDCGMFESPRDKRAHEWWIKLKKNLESVHWQEVMCLICLIEKIVGQIEFFHEDQFNGTEMVDYWNEHLDDFAKKAILKELGEEEEEDDEDEA